MHESTAPIHAITRASIAAALASLSLAMSTRAEPPVIYVDDSAPAGGDGMSWEHAFNDLQDALATWNSYNYGLEIHIAQGTYRPDRGSLNRDASFNLPPSQLASAFTLSLVGGYAGLGAVDPNAFNPAAFVSVLSGDLKHDDKPGFQNRADNSRTIVRLQAGRELLVSLRGLKIAGAHADATDTQTGAVVYNDGTRYGWGTRIRECTIADNEPGTRSGALFASYKYVSIEDSTIINNRGPGAYLVGSTIYGVNNRIADNSGGAIDASEGYGTIDLHNSLVAGNGVAKSQENIPTLRAIDIHLTDCAIVGNNTGSNPTIAAQEVVQLQGCTVTGNTTPGALVEAYDGPSFVKDTVIWGNLSRDGVAVVFGGYNYDPIVLDHSDIQGGRAAIKIVYGAAYVWGPGMIDADPLFKDPIGKDGNAATWADNDYTPSLASPCVDAAGRYVQGWEVDISGAPRFVDGNGDHIVAADIGAYELQGRRCPADVNGDGIVNDHDVLAFWSEFDRGYIEADFNHDGFVTGDDWDEFTAAFVSGC